MKFEDLPSRVRRVVMEEFAVGEVWFPSDVTTVEQLLNSLDRKAAAIRGAIWFRLTEVDEPRMSLSKVGIMFDRDHTSIMAAVKKFRAQRFQGWCAAKRELYALQRREAMAETYDKEAA